MNTFFRQLVNWANPAPTADKACENLLIKAEHVHDMMLWTDNTRYIEELLACFTLPIVTMRQAHTLESAHIALRHDVDWSIDNALVMARLESSINVNATYFLLHPDGFIQTSNYFGSITGNKLNIDPKLFDYAKHLIDLGHEVALHSDLMTLGLYTKRHPVEFLEQILESFQKNGIVIKGSVAHGSPKCHDFGYINFQLFQECAIFELDQKYMKPGIENDGFRIDKYTINMRDYDLDYEGNFIPWEVKLSDSRANWTLELARKKIDFQKFEDREKPLIQLQQFMAAKTPEGSVQCLVHPCHWNTVVNFNKKIADPINRKREEGAKTINANSIAARPNVIYAKHNPKFADYNKSYTENDQHFVIATSIKKFSENFIADKAGEITNVMEVGCGQGQYLDFLRQSHRTAAPDAEWNSVGIDGSLAAIEACAERYPESYWVADSIESYLQTVFTGNRDQLPWLRSIDLVVDKTGTTYIKDYEAAEEFFDTLIKVMAPRGMYLFIASRNFYENKLRKNIYNTWARHWMELAGEKFSRTDIFDDDLPDLKGYYKRIYWRT